MLYTLNCFLKIGGHQNGTCWSSKGEHSQLLKQAKPLTALVALKKKKKKT